jgi:ABC-type hemin transport system ATPase subunit
LALAWADSVVVLAHGRVAHQGAPQEVLIDRDIARRANLHRHTLARIYNNETRTVSLDALEGICDGCKHRSVKPSTR